MHEAEIPDSLQNRLQEEKCVLPCHFVQTASIMHICVSPTSHTTRCGFASSDVRWFVCLRHDRKQEALRRKEKSEAHLFMQVNVALDEHLCSHTGHDLFDTEKSQLRSVTYCVCVVTSLPE